MRKQFFENKKVLLVGLGILGGGTTMAKFILKEGGKLTITDLRSEEMLQKEISEVEKFASKYKQKVEFVLGNHTQEIFDEADEVVFNPAVPYFSQWPQYCLKKNKTFYNDMTLFQEYLEFKYKGKEKPTQIWVTGTRGKSTTSTFIKYLLGDKAILTGNVPGSGLLKMCDKKCDFFVLETSNYQLEYPVTNKEIIEPAVSVITNIFVDHINRHKTFEEYKRVKNLIYSYNPNCVLFLNKKEDSIKEIWKNKKHKNIQFINITNLPKLSYNQSVSASFAIDIAKYFGVKSSEIQKRLKQVKIPEMRQEIIFQKKNLTVINDSTATSPDGLISCLKNFQGAFFIIGGTDADLDFSDLVKEIKNKKLIQNKKVMFLAGTASTKILELLKVKETDLVLDNFVAILEKIKKQLKKNQKNTIILSPGAKSFGLFKNEYDRGNIFNKSVKKIFK